MLESKVRAGAGEHGAEDHLSFPKSKALHERACQTLAGGVSSQFRAVGSPHPMFYTHAKGARIWDADGHELLDFTLSQGPCILGHSHPELIRRVIESLQSGQLFAGQHVDELELAEAIKGCVPSAERVRFAVSGSEASHALLRLARHVTGRPKFIKFIGHYHGWLDNVSFSVNPPRDESNTPPAPVAWGGGIPASLAEDVIVLRWNDLDLVEEAMSAHGDKVAAIITEPVMCNQGCIEPLPGFLEGLRRLCDKYGTALIFDEIITGFRLGAGGAQGEFGVTPDMALFGKALGAGFPLAALVGKEKFMAPLANGQVYHAGTLNASNASIAAGRAVVEVMGRNNGEGYRHVRETGTRLRDGLAAIGEEGRLNVRVQGPGAMFHMGFSERARALSYEHVLDYDKALYSRFCQGMLAHGIRLIERGLWYVSLAHTDDDIDHALVTAREVLEEMGH
ncbi:aspartate aminotransferase family protein [Roseitalea porphyridii]|uniref:Aspartate aminotransferase family protein n=2 Tax=Roseitalea porphyridii TaxID=1852022 RepID=A0A4P6V236_9HYPH|nr:aspartate aminotransferase family protein [Roseitalea porphyridii]